MVCTRYTIIVPVYNVEKYLISCLESILCQDFQDFEVILIDDGSTDASGRICDDFSARDNRFSVIHKKNEGVSIARNVGIERAKGKWISFVDSDDTLFPNYLSSFDEIEDKSDLTYFGNYCKHEDGCDCSFLLPNRVWTGWNEIQEGMLLLKRNVSQYDYYGYTWNKFFRSDIIHNNNLRFIPGVTMKEDELFVDKYIQCCNTVETINNVLYCYRPNLFGLTNSHKSTDCLNLYLQNAEELVGKLSNAALISYHVSYLFDIKLQLLERSITFQELRYTKRDLLNFASRYYSMCGPMYYQFGTIAWSIWNSGHNSKARLFLVLNTVKRQLKIILERKVRNRK